MHAPEKEKLHHRLFRIGVLVKGIDGTVEAIGGALLYIVSPHMLSSFAILLLGDEISEQPRDAILNSIIQSFHQFIGGTRYFWATLLVAHGITKLIFVIGLLKNKLWAYPLAIGAFTLFIIYQIYSIAISPSLFVEVLTFFDVAIVVLIWFEYRSVKTH